MKGDCEMREKSLYHTTYSMIIVIILGSIFMFISNIARSETPPEIGSGIYEVAPGAVVSLTGGIAGDTRTYGFFGKLHIMVYFQEPTQTSILASDLGVKPDGLAAHPFPANDLLELSALAGEVVSRQELRFTHRADTESQAVELVLTATESGGLLLNGTYDEGCCDRYIFTFTDVELIPAAGMDAIYLPGVASIEGENSSQWRTDAMIFHEGRGPATITLTYIAEAAEEPFPTMTFDLDPGGASIFSDLLSFFPGSAGSKGYLVISSSYGVPIVTATTYNVTGDGDGAYGQALFPFTSDHCIAAGNGGYLVGLRSSGDLSSGYRSNIGLLNTSQTSESEVWIIKDIPTDKSSLSHSTSITLAPGQFLQRNVDDLGFAGIASLLRIEVESGGPVAVYGSVINNLTQDPRLVVAQPPPNKPWS
jgi:hypothetical protein